MPQIEGVAGLSFTRWDAVLELGEVGDMDGGVIFDTVQGDFGCVCTFIIYHRGFFFTAAGEIVGEVDEFNSYSLTYAN
jgi:hypothetical protein